MRRLGIAPVMIGALATVVATRILPPMIARTVGSARGMMGTDPFQILQDDHRRIESLLVRMTSGDTTALERQRLTLRLKHRLAAHALAEENAVYPLLEDETARQELYAEHAEMKVALHGLEHSLADQDAWAAAAARLRTVITDHIQEEEKVQFPDLRERLDGAAETRLVGEIAREKALLL